MGPAPRNQARFAALAIALTLVLSVVVSGKAAATAPVQTGCVWLGDVDEAALENALHAAWPSESIARWDAQISAKIVAIVLHLKGGGRIDVKLTNGARCSAPPVAEVAPSASRPPAPLLTAVGAVIRRVDRAGDRSERSPPLPPGSLLAVCAALVVLLAWRPSGATAAALAAALVLVVWGVGVATAELSPADRLPYPFGIAAVLLTLLLGALPKNHRREMGMPVVLVGVSLLFALATWPVLRLPFETDAETIRALLGWVDPFADFGHPFLPLWLSKLLAAGSLEPAAIRRAGLLFAWFETALIAVAAGRRAGPLAGLLAGAWAASAVWHRPGLSDLSDWNYAGAALVTWLLWLRGWQARQERAESTSTRQWLILAAALLWGLLSSYLMILPAVILAAIVARRELTGGRSGALQRRVGLGGVALVLGGGALGVMWVFRIRAGEPVEYQEGTWTLLADMWRALPMGATPLMTAPVLLGGGWLVRHRHRADSQFVLLTLAAVVTALAVLRPVVSIAPYYVTLLTPLGLEAAAVATVEVGAHWWRRTGRTKAAWVVAIVALAMGVHQTARLAHSPRGWGADLWSAFGQLWLKEPRPVLSAVEQLEFWLSYERMRAGRVAPASSDALDRLVAQQRQAVTRWRPGSGPCPVDRLTALGPSYLVHGGLPGDATTQRCLAELISRCQPVFPAQETPPAGRFPAGFYRCGGGPKAR